jgi:hypothetical protein
MQSRDLREYMTATKATMKREIEELVWQARESWNNEYAALVGAGRNRFSLAVCWSPILFNEREVLEVKRVGWRPKRKYNDDDEELDYDVITSADELWSCLEEIACTTGRLLSVHCDDNPHIINGMVLQRDYKYLPQPNCLLFTPLLEKQEQPVHVERLVQSEIQKLLRLDKFPGCAIKIQVVMPEMKRRSAASLLIMQQNLTEENIDGTLGDLRRYFDQYKSNPLPLRAGIKKEPVAMKSLCKRRLVL